MKRNNKRVTDLSVRELNLHDAHSYSRIATGNALHEHASFFEAHSLEEARGRIQQYSNKYEQLYGLFTKANRLVAVFDVVQDIDDGATVHYFVGERFYGNNYAVRGIQYLAGVLSGIYSHFHFEVPEDNQHSLNVQSKLGSDEDVSVNNFRNFVYSF